MIRQPPDMTNDRFQHVMSSAGSPFVIWDLFRRLPDHSAELLARLSYSAFIQLSDPVNFTATFVKVRVIGAPSAVPLCSVEKRRGPAFLYPAQVTITRLGFLGPPRW